MMMMMIQDLPVVKRGTAPVILMVLAIATAPPPVLVSAWLLSPLPLTTTGVRECIHINNRRVFVSRSKTSASLPRRWFAWTTVPPWLSSSSNSGSGSIIARTTSLHGGDWTDDWLNDDTTSSSSAVDSSSSSSAFGSVGDYVQGVHGGKYQFAAPGMNMAGLAFAETGYASSEPVIYDNNNNKPLPKWAQRLGTDPSELQRRAAAVFVVTPQQQPVCVTIRNQERTWEPFHVKIMQTTTTGTSRDNNPVVVVGDILTIPPKDAPFVFGATPTRGKLAPAGGVQNPYDPTHPYLDWVQVVVSIKTTTGGSGAAAAAAGPDEQGRDDYYLVIGTEEEQRFYKLVWSAGSG